MLKLIPLDVQIEKKSTRAKASLINANDDSEEIPYPIFNSSMRTLGVTGKIAPVLWEKLLQIVETGSSFNSRRDIIHLVFAGSSGSFLAGALSAINNSSPLPFLISYIYVPKDGESRHAGDSMYSKLINGGDLVIFVDELISTGDTMTRCLSKILRYDHRDHNIYYAVFYGAYTFNAGQITAYWNSPTRQGLAQSHVPQGRTVYLKIKYDAKL